MFRRKLPALIGLIFCLCCLCVLLLIGYLVDEGNQPPEGYAELQAVRQLHLKGSYESEDFSDFVFTARDNPSLSFDIKGYFVDDTIYFFFPQQVDRTALRLHWDSDTINALFLDGVSVTSHTELDCTEDLQLTDETGQSYSLVMRVTQLPVLALQTYEGQLVYPLGGYVPASGQLWDVEGDLFFSQVVQLRVRGNYTSTLPKLPYKMKTENKFSLFSLEKSSQWTLLANFLDPSMLRNDLAYRLAEALGMSYVPEQEFLELYLNGEYAGVYALTTQVGLHSGNIALDKITEAENGSYLLELDARSEGLPDTFVSLFDIPIVLKDPDSVTEEQRQQIQQELTRFETALLADDFTIDGQHYSELIDLDSFVDVYLVNEILRNGDACMPLSLFVYRDEEGRLAMGPVWDFDLSTGYSTIEGGENPQGVSLSDSHWFGRMLEDPVFRAAALEEYQKLDGFLEDYLSYLDDYRKTMSAAANNNFIITYIGVNEYSNLPTDDPFLLEVDTLEQWLIARFDWLDENQLSLWG